MPDMRARMMVVPDDGSDGVFWRAGERWLREDGIERRLLDITPEGEALYMRIMTPTEEAAKLASLEGVH